jgi:hypothetical protein
MKLPIIRLSLSALLLALSFPAEAQQAAKVYRIGYVSNVDASGESARAEAIRMGCASLATSKDRTSPSNIDMGRESKIDTPKSRLSWCVSRLMSSWWEEGPG